VITISTSPGWTGSPPVTRTPRTVPATPASMTYSIFIDSMTATGVEASTTPPAATSTRTMVPFSGERTSPTSALSTAKTAAPPTTDAT